MAKKNNNRDYKWAIVSRNSGSKPFAVRQLPLIMDGSEVPLYAFKTRKAARNAATFFAFVSRWLAAVDARNLFPQQWR